jgi:hypothetical protein
MTGQIAMYVSTSLQQWQTAEGIFARDAQINDTAYRRLDPEYYAWLRSKMNLAKMAAAAEQLRRDEFDELRRRFNTMHEWAVAQFGEQELTMAIRDLDARDYTPPVPEAETVRRIPRTPESSASDAVALVDAISEHALALGWKRERLYGSARDTRLFSQNRSLVSYLKPGGRIGELALQSIELIGPPPDEVLQRFHNPDVDQPWIVKVSSATENTDKSA